MTKDRSCGTLTHFVWGEDLLFASSKILAVCQIWYKDISKTSLCNSYLRHLFYKMLWFTVHKAFGMSKNIDFVVFAFCNCFIFVVLRQLYNLNYIFMFSLETITCFQYVVFVKSYHYSLFQVFLNYCWECGRYFYCWVISRISFVVNFEKWYPLFSFQKRWHAFC